MRRVLLIAVCLLFILTLVPMASAQQGHTVHVVQPGENLFRISLRYGVSMSAIAQENGIANINLIFVGQALRIPIGA